MKDPGLQEVHDRLFVWAKLHLPLYQKRRLSARTSLRATNATDWERSHVVLPTASQNVALRFGRLSGTHFDRALKMQFHHSTHWSQLQAFMAGDLLSPGQFSNDDLRNPQLALLNKHGLYCLWFTTQVWSGNRFGPYVLRYEEADLVMPILLELDDHNGARCFLSAPPILAKWLGRELEITPVQSTPSVWRRTEKEDRVDLLVPWRVPVSHSLHVVAGDTGRPLEDDANFARARLMAYALVNNDRRFNASLDAGFGAAGAVGNLLGQLTKRFSNSALSPSMSQTNETPRQLLDKALRCLVKADKSAARLAAGMIGDVSEVASVLAPAINILLGTSLTAEEIENAT